MSFSLEIKKEILSHEMNEEEVINFLQGFLWIAGIPDEDHLNLNIHNEQIRESICIMLSHLEIPFEKKNNIQIINIPKSEFDDIVMKLPTSFFGGIFVGGGSISRLESTSYHLELQFNNDKRAGDVQRFLNKYNFNFKMIRRRTKDVLYIKKSEEISDFLKAIQSIRMLLQFEEALTERDYLNNLNRMGHLDVHNAKKLADASFRHKKNYNFIIQKGLQKLFNNDELFFYKIKLENPDISLNALSKKLENYKIYKSKSGLNHWLIKLKKIIKKNL